VARQINPRTSDAWLEVFGQSLPTDSPPTSPAVLLVFIPIPVVPSVSAELLEQNLRHHSLVLVIQ
jgi:hypothetical protein